MSRMATAASHLIVFDFDGTVADTWRDIAAALNRSLDEAGFPAVEGGDVRFWIGDGARKLLERALPEAQRTRAFVDALYARFSEHYDRMCLETTEPYPGVVECLESLQGQPLAIASNKPERFLMPIVDGLGLKDHFAVIAGGDTLAARKPDPAVLREVRGRLSAAVEAVWMVGDSAVDVETGRGAGARTIGCAWGLRGREELRAAGVEFLIEHPREIPALVRAHR